MNKSIWEETIREDADEEGIGPHNRCEGRICTKEGEGVFAVKRGKRGGERICKRAAEERIHSAVEITANGTGVLCRKKGWEKEDGSRLPVS